MNGSDIPDADIRPQTDESEVRDYMDYIGAAGFQRGPVLTSGAIGPSFLTWAQRDFREQRKKFGEGELDAGSFYLTQIHFDKETGTASVGQMDVGPSAWYGESPSDRDQTERSTVVS